MKRFAANFLYCNPQKIIPNGVVEVDKEGIVSSMFSLNDLPQECHTTQFFNGIIIPNLIEVALLSSYSHKNVVDLLNTLYATKKCGLEIGHKANFYLLEKLDLVQKKFLSESSVRILIP